MNSSKHILQYKRIRETIDALMRIPTPERDAAPITTASHWASFHLLSAIIDQLSIPDKYKHRNHRGVRYILRDNEEVRAAIGGSANLLLELYNEIETGFMSKFQYGNIDKVPDYGHLMKLLDKMVEICKIITTREASKQ
ncbi:MAG: hypothetical protein ACTSU5_02550 [Promethearchaeota archaeon]